MFERNGQRLGSVLTESAKSSRKKAESKAKADAPSTGDGTDAEQASGSASDKK